MKLYKIILILLLVTLANLLFMETVAGTKAFWFNLFGGVHSVNAERFNPSAQISLADSAESTDIAINYFYPSVNEHIASINYVRNETNVSMQYSLQFHFNGDLLSRQISGIENPLVLRIQKPDNTSSYINLSSESRELPITATQDGTYSVYLEWPADKPWTEYKGQSGSISIKTEAYQSNE